MIAEQLITSHVVPLKRFDTGALALSMMEELRISHLPVVDGADFLGILSEKEILESGDPDYVVGLHPFANANVSVAPGEHVFEVLKLFSSMNLTVVPVVGENRHYLGSIILQRVVHALAELIGIDEPGGIIVLEINDKDYSMAEILQVVESNEARILSCLVHSTPDSTILRVTLKVSRVDIGPLLQAFFRLNYHVVSSWSKQDSYTDELHERYDALMNYLSI
jgi:acetoin utilization protein AcuB